MKYSVLAIFALILSLTSCNKEAIGIPSLIPLEIRTTSCMPHSPEDYPVDYGESSLCSSDTCMQYLSIWQELMEEKNDWAPTFFDDHIEVLRTKLIYGRRGVSFYVCYEVKIDWAIAFKCNKFIINIKEGNTNWSSVDLPRAVNLTKEEIQLALENRAFSSSISHVSERTEIQYTSIETSLEALIEFSGVNILCFNRIELDKETGHLLFKAYAEYDNEENACITGTIDLITGEISVRDGICAIIG